MHKTKISWLKVLDEALIFIGTRAGVIDGKLLSEPKDLGQITAHLSKLFAGITLHECYGVVLKLEKDQFIRKDEVTSLEGKKYSRYVIEFDGMLLLKRGGYVWQRIWYISESFPKRFWYLVSAITFFVGFWLARK